MKNSASLIFTVLAGIVTVGTAVADDGLRCGSKIVVTGMTQSEVLSYCGGTDVEERGGGAGAERTAGGRCDDVLPLDVLVLQRDPRAGL